MHSISVVGGSVEFLHAHSDTAVQRRAHEEAKRPTRPSVCNGWLAGEPRESERPEKVRKARAQNRGEFA